MKFHLVSTNLKNEIAVLKHINTRLEERNKGLRNLTESMSKRIHDLDHAFSAVHRELVEQTYATGCLDDEVKKLTKNNLQLERDLDTARQVAEYWKLQAQANQILADIYKQRGGDLND